LGSSFYKTTKWFYKTTKWLKKRECILRRDEYRCQECKRYGKSTQAETVHHINPYELWPELALIDWNLISFCGSCHGKMHDRTTDELTDAGKRWADRVREKLEIHIQSRKSG
jgi:5-methylcytosine-specific restriction endonuclease McrA